MKNYTTFINKKILLKEISSFLQMIEKFYINSELAIDNKFIVTTNKSYHFFSKLLVPNKNDTKTVKTLKKIFIRDIYNIETISADSSLIYFFFLFQLMEILKNEENFELFSKLQIQEAESAIFKLKKIIENSSNSCDEYLLEQVISSSFQDSLLIEVCKQALNLSGFEGKIILEDSKQKEYTIELKEGYNFKLKPYKFFLNNKTWDRRECKVLVVDGFVESVSEIDQLLLKAHEYQQPLAIISHGFSEEVVATLYTNKNNGKLDVLPIRLETDLNSLNVINDIGVVCGMDPISSLKGELLTFVRYDDLPVVDKISVNDLNTSIENHKTYKQVLAQIKMLLDKRFDNQHIEDIQILLENRIKSLSPNTVVIYLPEMSKIQNDSIRIMFDNCLRKIKTCINYNFLEPQNLFDTITWDKVGNSYDYGNKLPSANNDTENLLLRTLLEMGDLYFSRKFLVSTLSYYLGIMTAFKTAILLINSNGLISIEE